jgi:hypothetical protein
MLHKKTISSSASEEISHILWNPKADYRIHENLPIYWYPEPHQSTPDPTLLLEDPL